MCDASGSCSARIVSTTASTSQIALVLERREAAVSAFCSVEHIRIQRSIFPLLIVLVWLDRRQPATIVCLVLAWKVALASPLRVLLPVMSTRRVAITSATCLSRASLMNLSSRREQIIWQLAFSSAVCFTIMA